MNGQYYDIVIIGGGAAGLSAAIFASRKKVSTLVITKDLGGQATLATTIENYPGILSIEGKALLETMYHQARSSGAEFLSSEADAIQLKKDSESPEKKYFSISTPLEEIHAGAVILSFGLTPKDLNIAGEKELKGKGVYYEVVGKEEFFKGKEVAVIGGGNSALMGAIKIAALAKIVYIVHHREDFRADAAYLDQLKNRANVKFVLNARVKEIFGKDWISGIRIEQNGNSQELTIQALYAAIGYQSRTSWIQNLVLCNEKGEIITDKYGMTSIEGIFSAGDISDSGYKQCIVSAGDGARAALSATSYIFEQQGVKRIAPDWGK